MKVDGNQPLCASEWRPKATKVLQHVCSCSGYVHTNARSTHGVVRKCQLDVQFYAKNASRPAERRRIDSPWRPRRKRNRFAARAFGWHADSREIHQETVIFCLFHLLVSKKRPNEWRYTELFILWKRTTRRKILFPIFVSLWSERAKWIYVFKSGGSLGFYYLSLGFKVSILEFYLVVRNFLTKRTSVHWMYLFTRTSILIVWKKKMIYNKGEWIDLYRMNCLSPGLVHAL